MGNTKKTIRTTARHSATPTRNTNHQGEFFFHINTEITKHDTATGYMVSNDMLIPYINKLDKSGDINWTDKQIEIFKLILTDNRILLYYDQYLNIHDKINNAEPNKNNIKIRKETDLFKHFFELPILLDICRQIQQRNQSEFTRKNIINLYYQEVWQKIMPIQHQLKIEYDKMSGMESRMLFMHGLETDNMFVVPDDVIICKVTSYNYIAASGILWLTQLKKVLSYYKNNNILNLSCCTKDGMISICFPNQLCNDTYLQIIKPELIIKNYMGLYSINDENKLIKHKLSNYDFDNMFVKEIKLSNLIIDKEVKNKILIIHCCRGQDIGTLALYTEFNYRLERIQLLLSRTFCNCSKLIETTTNKFKLPSGFFGLLNFYTKTYKKNISIIWNNDSEYTPFYDTYLSTDITKNSPLKKQSTTTLINVVDIIENPSILKRFDIYTRVRLFVKLYEINTNTIDTKHPNIEVIPIILLNLINNSYEFKSFKFEKDEKILTKSLFYYKLLDTLYANNTLNITKCSKLLLVVLEQLNIFLLQSFKLLQNYPNTATVMDHDNPKKSTLKQTKPSSKNKAKTNNKINNTKSLIKGSARLSSGKGESNLLEFTIKLLDLYYKLSNRFGYKIKNTIIQNINQNDFKLLLEQFIVKPKNNIIASSSNHDEIIQMIDYLSKLCKGCLNI